MRPAGTRVWKGWTSNAVKPAPNCPQLLDFLPGFSPSPSGAVPHVGCSMPCSGSGARVLLGCQAGRFGARLHCPQVCALRQQIQGLQLADHGRVELPRDTLTPGRFSSGLPVDLSVSHGDCKSIQMRQLLLPALGAVGGSCIRGFFRVLSAQPPPWARSFPMMGNPQRFCWGFQLIGKYCLHFFLRNFFFMREGNNPSLRQVKSWMPLTEQVAEVLFLESVSFLLEESPALRTSRIHQLLCSDLASRRT